jgi:hypothetical protein
VIIVSFAGGTASKNVCKGVFPKHHKSTTSSKGRYGFFAKQGSGWSE